jgi:hypothetical protein
MTFDRHDYSMKNIVEHKSQLDHKYNVSESTNSEYSMKNIVEHKSQLDHKYNVSESTNSE